MLPDTARALVFVGVLLPLAGSGCGEAGPAADRPAFRSAAKTLTKSDLADEIGLDWERDVELEESERVVNVEISVRPVGEEDYLVADAEEAQVRRYGPDGSLEYAFGHEGGGPLGFSAPSAALSIGEDSVLVVDLQAKLAIVSPDGDSALATHTLPLGPIYDADLLDGRHVLLSGRSVENPHRLHVVDYRSGEIVRSFFPPPVGDERSVRSVGLTNSTVRGDTIAAVFALTDTIYYFDARGQELRQREFSSDHFREWQRPPPGRSRAELREWYRSFSYTTHVFRPTDSLTIVQYQDRARDMTPRWRLVGLRRDGTTAFDLTHTPNLLTVRPKQDRLVFVSPRSLTPNRWSIAVLP